MHRITKKSVAILLAVVLVVALAMAAGCTPTTTTPTDSGETTTDKGVKGGTLSFYVGEPAYIDPYNTQESEGTQVEQAVFDSLTEVDPLDPTKVLPAAAETWTVNADATVWTFKLNPDDKFHDGTPVTANDFVYAFNRIANPQTLNTATAKSDPSIISYHLAVIKGFDEVEAGTTPVDDRTQGRRRHHAGDHARQPVCRLRLRRRAPGPGSGSPEVRRGRRGLSGQEGSLRRDADRQRPVQDVRAVGPQPGHQRRPQRRLLRQEAVPRWRRVQDLQGS